MTIANHLEDAAEADSCERPRAPIGLLAELTYRCPLQCPYCSNPLALDPRAGERNDAQES